MAKRALITGVTGQDGSYLSELLLAKGYEVHGVARRPATVAHGVILHTAAVEDGDAIQELVAELVPQECYHLAAQTVVHHEDDQSTVAVNVGGTESVLRAVKRHAPQCRVFFAASSEVFGCPDESPQKEATRFRPRSIYGVTKAAGLELTRVYRETRGLHASSGILYNHESPRRPEQFVTRKISRGVAEIVAGEAKTLTLGDLGAVRDWGHARDYVEAMWRTLQQDVPGDYVIATGQPHTVRDFARLAFAHVGLDFENHVVSDPRLVRPRETVALVGDPRRAGAVLGWRATTTFDELVAEMVTADCERASTSASRKNL